jgi:hypothetical protein
MCDHSRVKCLDCGAEGSPASLMASRPRKRGPEAVEQSRRASKIAGEKRRKPLPEPDTCPKCNRPMHRFHDCALNPVANPIVCSE